MKYEIKTYILTQIKQSQELFLKSTAPDNGMLW